MSSYQDNDYSQTDPYSPPPKRKRKWPWIVGALAVLAIVGSAVSATDSSEDTPMAETATSTAAPTTEVEPPEVTTITDEVHDTPAMSDEEITDMAYLTVLDTSGVEYSSKEAAIFTAHSVCDALDSGLTFRQLGMSLIANDDVPYTPEEIGTVMGSAIAGYCPQYTNQMSN